MESFRNPLEHRNNVRRKNTEALPPLSQKLRKKEATKKFKTQEKELNKSIRKSNNYKQVDLIYPNKGDDNQVLFVLDKVSKTLVADFPS